jgi:hypothetical protein
MTRATATLALVAALVWLAVGLAGGFARARLDGRASMPGPRTKARAPDEVADRIERNAECVGCHPVVAREWARSLHRRSFSEPMFQAAFAREGEADFCHSCHAPEAAAAEIGVGCVGCHLVEGEILAAPAPAGRDEAASPHALRREPDFAGPAACAGCHEFWFPAAGRGGRDLKMQRTVSEHARSPAHEQACQSCHMPPSGEGGALHRSHDFAVVGEPRMLRAAAEIAATRSPGQVEVRLEPRAVGHAFPTGDLFRRLAVSVTGEGCEQTRYLARHFGAERLPSGAGIKIELSDDRVGLGARARVVGFELEPACEDVPLRWAVRYQRVLDAPVGAEERAEVWDELTIAAGTLAPPQQENER